MAYNRYVNQNGRRRRMVIQDEPRPLPNPSAAPVPAPPSVPKPPVQKPGLGLDLDGIGRMLKNILPTGLDTGDLLLAAVLFLLYLDSGDIEMLIMLGALIFMK